MTLVCARTIWGWIVDEPTSRFSFGGASKTQDPDYPMLILDVAGEKIVTVSLRELRNMLDWVSTIPDLTKRIETLEKARGTSHGR